MIKSVKIMQKYWPEISIQPVFQINMPQHACSYFDCRFKCTDTKKLCSHYVDKHSTKFTLKCTMCDFESHTYKSLAYHYTYKHNTTHCLYCAKNCKSQDSLTRHLKSCRHLRRIVNRTSQASNTLKVKKTYK